MSLPFPQRSLLSAVGALVLFATGVAAAVADSPLTTTTATTTTVETTTSSSTTVPTTSTNATTVTSEPSTTIASTVAASTSSSETTTGRATTSAPRTTSAAAPVPGPESPLQELSLGRGCPVAGLLLLLPHRTPLAVGALADAAVGATTSGDLVYRAGGSLANASSVVVRAAPCEEGASWRGEADLRSLSLFDGEVTATSVHFRSGASASTTIAGLSVDDKTIAATPGTRVRLSGWGELLVEPSRPVQTTAGGATKAALAIHLLLAHDGLPAGAWLLVAAATAPATSPSALPRRHARHRKRSKPKTGQPLKVTPPLADRQYIFPVVGPSDYVDTYGAFRSDVPGNWHHGDDIFAPLGTPVVAVAGGTINRVGWEKVGGWRLWVRDGAGDEFYYAHLSGYAPSDLHTDRVKAGEVIGFIGNTGDAFTTSPHLHFEIHPRQLLTLGYDGAVDPTTYLNGWRHLQQVDAPRPTHPPLPTQPLIRQEASYVFRELLAARHLTRHAPSASQRPHVPIPAGANGPPPTLPPSRREAAALAPATHAGVSTLTFALITALIAAAASALIVVLPDAHLRERLSARRAYARLRHPRR